MTGPEKLSKAMFSITHPQEFRRLALELFVWHYDKNLVYRQFCDFTKRSPENVQEIEQIPCLPVNLFRHHCILPEGYEPKLYFETSGTSSGETGRHFVVDTALYLRSAMASFELFYGDISQYAVLALLPGYLERQNSSLVYMVDHWIQCSDQSVSGFYLYEYEKLHQTLLHLRQQKQKTLLIGVTHALVDFSEKHTIDFPELIVMETGGMKGRRAELTREELHSLLKPAFGVSSIHSEYGMTELLSQAYSQGDGLFRCPPWMKVQLRDPNDPLTRPDNKNSGAINIIDLANSYSCPFIATDDQGILYEDGSFKINGRLDFSIVRGCSTMVFPAE